MKAGNPVVCSQCGILKKRAEYSKNELYNSEKPRCRDCKINSIVEKRKVTRRYNQSRDGLIKKKMRCLKCDKLFLGNKYNRICYLCNLANNGLTRYIED